MPLSHLFLALLVVFIWGTNFVVIKWGLADLPPFLFASLRFTLSALPLAFFVRRPSVSLAKLSAFGVLLGVGQFGAMFYAMQRDITPGLASLVVQMQVFFTIGLSMAVKGERPRRASGFALLLAIAGMAMIAANMNGGTVTFLGLALMLVAAVGWAGANMIVKSVGRVDSLGFMVWSSLFAAPALFVMSLALEGPARIASSLSHASVSAFGSVAWQAFANTLFGYGAWNWLLARHPASTVTPVALLVPVFGMTASSLLVNEAMPAWKVGAATLVITALAVNVFATRAPAPRFETQ